MAGLLGDSFDDPRSLAVMQLAAGLLSPGSFGQGLGKGITGYQGTLANAQTMELTKARIQEAQQAALMQQLQMRRSMMQLDDASRWDQPQGASSPQSPATQATVSQGGSGGPAAANAASMNAPPSGGAPSLPRSVAKYQGMPLEQLRDRMNIGLEPKDAVELWKAANVGTAMTAGQYRMLPGQVPQYLADPSKPATMSDDGKTAVPLTGSAETAARAAGLAKDAELGATNRGTPLSPEQLERYGMQPGATAADLLRRGPSAAPAQVGFSGPVSGPEPLGSIGADGSMKGGALAQLSPQMQRAVLASMGKNGVGTVNGQPLNAGVPAASAPPASGGLKTAAQMEEEKLRAAAGVKLQTEPAISYANDTSKTAAADKAALDVRVSTGQDLMLRVAEARQALEQFKPGMGAETRLQVARAAQAMGLPDSLVGRLNMGDVGAKQEFMKLSAQTAMESLKQAMGGSGRITQAEFKVFQANNPNIELDSRAINKIYDFATKVYSRDFAEQQARTSFVGNGGDPTQWPAHWAKTLDPTGRGSINTPGTEPGPKGMFIDPAAIAPS